MLQVLAVAEEYADLCLLKKIHVFDDGIVKGLIHLEGTEIAELYVDHFFQNQGIGAALIEFAKKKYHSDFLWALEKNVRAIRFYETHGFYVTGEKKYESGTIERLLLMRRRPAREESVLSG
ncbi:GNAT family N-acetyltransferase [Lachnoclostridium sp. Marseille-P6806]|uniref:GNAT family N-acetyltransferase n=1 Tax=Lachnoclostridium sp. Marseille-P6806 TaxID=2364793 RepID=UPI001F5F581B|nr:GNAT family N-acetyltransferase [Lachnoclostridium sp. Marseille-P6806]